MCTYISGNKYVLFTNIEFTYILGITVCLALLKVSIMIKNEHTIQQMYKINVKIECTGPWLGSESASETPPHPVMCSLDEHW